MVQELGIDDTAAAVRPRRPHAAAGSVPAAYARTARLRADEPAVVGPGPTLTHRQLNERANRLAHRLLRAGVRPEEPVALLAERSAEVVVAMLAILKAGAAYLPLHERDPLSRMRQVVEETSARFLLADRAMLGRGAPRVERVIVLDPADALADLPTADPGIAPLPDQLAYLMYTSGSSGIPKGVAVTHRGLLELADDRLWRDAGPQRVPMLAPYAFDVSSYEVWVCLLSGGRTVVPAPGEIGAADLARLIAVHELTAVHVTAGLFAALAEEDPGCFAGVREVLTGGDVISPRAVRRVLEQCPGTVVRCMYGPTETTLFASRYSCTEPDRVPAPVPLGGPLDGMAGYVLDDRLAPVPGGATGELYLSGSGLARGYRGRPAQTAGRFVADPAGGPGTRMYRTGDLARIRPDGLLEFAGRVDDQVKIRGFRVEPGEVESALRRFPGLADVAVVARRDTGTDGADPAEKRLVAYVVPAVGERPDTGRLPEFARGALPDYMVPSAFVVLDRLPLTANAKLDRAALPEPRPADRPDAAGPRNPVEQHLCRMFAQLLEIPAPGIDESFFDLGGHSLSATRLISRLRSHFGVRVSMRTLLTAPTVRALAAALGGAQDRGSVLAPLLPLRRVAGPEAVFCVHPFGGLGWCYTGLLPHIPPEYSVYALQARGLEAPEQAAGSLAEMAEDYLALIREVQPSGPYRLFGWSFGGNVAQTMAARLRRHGEEVALLAVADAHHGGSAGRGDEGGGAERTLAEVGAADAGPGAGPVSEARILELLRARGDALGSMDEETIAGMITVAGNNLRLSAAAEPEPFDGDVLFFEAADERGAASELAATWRPFVRGPIETHVLPFAHGELMSPPALAVLGPVLRRRLASRGAARPTAAAE